LFVVSVLSGGIASPFLLVWGTAHSTGSAASLLLNLEAVFTALLAWAVFRERLTLTVLAGLALVTAGGMVVSSGGGDGGEKSFLGALSVAGCCLAWAVDNNAMVRLKGVPPPLLTLWKGLLAGIVLLVSSFISGSPMPAQHSLVEAVLVGTGCYGIALLCFIHALNNAGAGRAAAYFAVAPFIGAAFSIILLNEPMSIRLFIAAGLMAAGLVTLFLEKREPNVAGVAEAKP
jgi:drug/metabolite transporter (DMT)-like permease